MLLKTSVDVISSIKNFRSTLKFVLSRQLLRLVLPWQLRVKRDWLNFPLFACHQEEWDLVGMPVSCWLAFKLQFAAWPLHVYQERILPVAPLHISMANRCSCICIYITIQVLGKWWSYRYCSLSSKSLFLFSCCHHPYCHIILCVLVHMILSMTIISRLVELNKKPFLNLDLKTVYYLVETKHQNLRSI